jgi:hypothetical protein
LLQRQRNPLAKIDVDLARFDFAVAPNDELGRNRQKIAAVTLEDREVETQVKIKLFDIGADPEHQAQRECVAEIDIGQYREWKIIFGDGLFCVSRRLRHDRDQLGAEPANIGFDLRECTQIEFAVGAPVPAVHADDDRPGFEQPVERNKLPGLIRQQEIRHCVADSGRNRA